MIDNRLTTSSYISIPLKKIETCTLNPQPNWLIIENVFGKEIVNLPYLGTTVCARSVYKIVFREILPARPDLTRIEEMRELIYEDTNLNVPLSIIPALSSHQTVYDNIANINYLLNFFEFRGVLEDFKLEVDDVVLLDIITPPIQEETPDTDPLGEEETPNTDPLAFDDPLDIITPPIQEETPDTDPLAFDDPLGEEETPNTDPLGEEETQPI
jgi:hypothetical protein